MLLHNNYFAGHNLCLYHTTCYLNSIWNAKPMKQILWELALTLCFCFLSVWVHQCVAKDENHSTTSWSSDCQASFPHILLLSLLTTFSLKYISMILWLICEYNQFKHLYISKSETVTCINAQWTGNAHKFNILDSK